MPSSESPSREVRRPAAVRPAVRAVGVVTAVACLLALAAVPRARTTLLCPPRPGPAAAPAHLAAPPPAPAWHPNSWSRSLVVVAGARVELLLHLQVLSLVEVIDLDGDGDGLVSAAEAEARRDAVAEYVRDHWIVRAGEEPGGPAVPLELVALQVLTEDRSALDFEQFVDLELVGRAERPLDLMRLEVHPFLDTSPRHQDVCDVLWLGPDEPRAEGAAEQARAPRLADVVLAERLDRSVRRSLRFWADRTHAVLDFQPAGGGTSEPAPGPDAASNPSSGEGGPAGPAGGTGDVEPDVEVRGPAAEVTALDDFVLGIEHILGGPDHVLYVLGLLVAARRLASLLAVVTAFTLAHSLTLGLAALEVVRVPGRPVEVLIGLSIAWVGGRTLWEGRRREARELGGSGRGAAGGRRLWLEALVFGLAHGLGFAAVLSRHLDEAGALGTLVLFNLGVEAGQVAVVLGALGGLGLVGRWLPPRTAAAPRLVHPWLTDAVSLVALGAGAYWAVTRAMHG